MAFHIKKIILTSAVVSKDLLTDLASILGENANVKLELPSSEIIKFSSIKEITESKTLPDKIKEMTITDDNLDNDSVSAVLKLSSKYFMTSIMDNCVLSSSNRSKLLEKEESIKNIFRKFQTNYYWFFPRQFSTSIFSFLITISIFSLMNSYNPFIQISGNATLWGEIVAVVGGLIFISFIPALLIDGLFLDKIYLFFSFELSGIRPMRFGVRTLFWVVFSGILVSYFYSLTTLTL